MPGSTTVDINGYTVDDDLASIDDLFKIATGATLVLLGEGVLTDDAVEGPGRVSVRGPTTINGALTFDDEALFVDMSSVTQNGGILSLNASFEDSTPVTVRNIAGATWNLANDAEIDAGYTNTQFVNLGLLEQTGASSSSIIDGAFFDRRGTISIEFGLEFDADAVGDRFIDDTIEGSGYFDLQGRKITVAPVSAHPLPLYLYNVLVGSDISTSLTSLFAVRIVDDVTISSAAVSIDILNLGVGSVLSLTNPTASVGIGDEIIGAGEVDFTGADEQVDVGDIDLKEAVSFVNSGDLSISGSFSAFAADDDQIVIENQKGAIWNQVSPSPAPDYFDANGTSVLFENYGIFDDLTNSDTYFTMNVVNDGAIKAPPGKLGIGEGSWFDDDLTGAGTVEIGPGAVTADSVVGGGQTFIFNSSMVDGDEPTLTLNDVQQFAGLISGYDQNGAMEDQIVVNTADWQYQDFVANSSGTGGSLMFTNGKTETAVSLTGSYDPSGFHAAVSGSTTTITYSE